MKAETAGQVIDAMSAASDSDVPASPVGRGLRDVVSFLKKWYPMSGSSDKTWRQARCPVAEVQAVASEADEELLAVRSADGMIHGWIPSDPSPQTKMRRSISMDLDFQAKPPSVANLSNGRVSGSIDGRAERYTLRESSQPRSPSPTLVTEGILTKDELAVISSSWALIAGQLKTTLDFGTVFYRHLFAIAPETASFFSQQSCVQEMAFSLMFRSLIVNLERTRFVVSALQKCAHRHVRYGVKLEHFPTVGRALVAAIMECLGGEEALEPHVGAAWIKLWSNIVEVMSEEIRKTEANPCPFCSKDTICPNSIDLGPVPTTPADSGASTCPPACPAKKGKVRSLLGR